MVTFVIRGPAADGLFFELTNEEFLWRLEFKDGIAFARRNEHQVSAPLFQPVDEVRIMLFWGPELLGLSTHSRRGSHERDIRTPFTVPPPAVIRAARAQLMLPPEQPFASRRDVTREVTTQLRALGGVLAGGAWKSFWSNDQPRREPELTSIVDSYIRRQLELIKGIEVHQESKSGSGRMDFLFVGETESRERVRVCCEFKLGHSDDLQHGIEVQLPAYMQEQGTDQGVFAVLDFGANYPPKRPFDLPGFTVDSVETILKLQGMLVAGQRNLQYVQIPVHKPKSPSDK